MNKFEWEINSIEKDNNNNNNNKNNNQRMTKVVNLYILTISFHSWRKKFHFRISLSRLAMIWFNFVVTQIFEIKKWRTKMNEKERRESEKENEANFILSTKEKYERMKVEERK